MTLPDLPSQPPATPPTVEPLGWYLAADDTWRQTATPPAEGWWLASDQRWYPPDMVSPIGDDAWRASRWGFGEFGWGMLIFIAGSLIASVILVVVLIANGTLDEGSTDTSGIDLSVWAIAGLLVVNFIAFIGVPYLATRLRGLGSLARDFGLTFRWVDVPLGLGGGLLAMFGGGALGTAMDNALGADEATNNVPIESVNGWLEFAVILLFVGVLTPVAEELFFRGLFMRSGLKRGWSMGLTIVATTLAFTLPHLASVPEWPGVATLTVVITVFGLVLAGLTALTRLRLGAAIIAHTVINSLAIIFEFWPG